MSTLTTQTKVLTNAILKEILSDALVNRGTASDMDTAKSPGAYYVGDGTANRPTGGFYGVLIVVKAGEMLLQICVYWYGNCCLRCNPYNGAWSAWRKINIT